MLDKRLSILIIFFFSILTISCVLIYYRVFIAQDYLISAQVPCDPNTESCFVYVCDPQVEECGDFSEEEYYKIIYKEAKNIAPCDIGATECLNKLACSTNEQGCLYEVCDTNNTENLCDTIE